MDLAEKEMLEITTTRVNPVIPIHLRLESRRGRRSCRIIIEIRTSRVVGRETAGRKGNAVSRVRKTETCSCDTDLGVVALLAAGKNCVNEHMLRVHEVFELEINKHRLDIRNLTFNRFLRTTNRYCWGRVEVTATLLLRVHPLRAVAAVMLEDFRGI